MSNKNFLPIILLSVWCFLMMPTKGFAQKISEESRLELKQMEDSLIRSADSMYNTMIPDFRIEFCEQFVKQLIRTLKVQGSYQYPFDSLRKYVNIINTADNSFRIFNWAIAYSDVRLRYYAAIQMNNPELKLFPLFDNSDLLSKFDEENILGAREWVGGLIYNIIERKVEEETVYCLLGLNDGNPISTKKFIDPLRFTEKGPQFGAAIFAVGNERDEHKTVNRFVLEYKKGVSVGMNWDEEKNAILFDDLASQINDPNRKYTFIPTGQYNGLRWNGKYWRLIYNMIPVLELKDGNAPDSK